MNIVFKPSNYGCCRLVIKVLYPVPQSKISCPVKQFQNRYLNIAIKPFHGSVYIDLRKTWLWSRIKELELWKLILKEDRPIEPLEGGGLELRIQ
jgi:hypothetical protein